MRETLAADSKSVMNLFDDGLDKVRVAYRTATGGGTSYFTAATNNTVPVWLKLARVGTNFTGSYSSDGSNWTTLGTASVTMSNTIYVGLVVCSRNTGILNTGTFDNLSGDAWYTAPVLPGMATIQVNTDNGGQLILNWPAEQGWRLQVQTNQPGVGLTTNWIDLSNALPPFTNAIDPAAPAVFYRLKLQ